MPAQIRPTRLDVTDRFPMVGFKIRADAATSQAEVAIGIDPGLFSAEGKKNRTAANFYSTRGNGGVRFDRGEAGFTIPPEVLARFIGSEKLYFGLATAGEGGAMKVAVMPSTSSPYISIKGLSGRSMARVRVLPNRQQRAAGYGRNGQTQLEWAGDITQPGMTTIGNGDEVAVADKKANGATPPVAAPYDDGFGPMPGTTPPGTTRVSAPVAQGLARRRAFGLDYSDDPEAHGIEGPAYSEVLPSPRAQARGLSVPAPDYPRASRFAPSPAVNAGRSGQTIDCIVIHITDAPTTSSTVNHFTAPGAQASAHYLVGQDGEVVQFVAETDTAWHARGVNSRSVGIEHVAIKQGGVDYPRPNGTVQHFNYLPPTDTQYSESAALVTYLCGKYGLTPDRATIIGHREADPHTSHTSCPDGAWNWDHFMDVVTNRYCAAQPAATAQGLTKRQTKSVRSKAVAHAMVVGLEDREKVRKYARDYIDLFKWSPAQSLVRDIEARGFSVQSLDAAAGDLNLDFYKVRITSFPSGWDAPRLLTQFIRDINSFLDSGNTSFAPYDDIDAQKLASANPLGTVFELNIFGPDNAAIVISDVKPQFYAVTTIHTPRTGDHPVSGHRQFGYFVVDGVTTFYTRGADRATLGFPGTETLIFAGAEKLWESFQTKLAAFVNDNGGTAEILEPFSERFNATAVREELGGFDVAQGLARTRSMAIARAMATGAFTVNWDEVELIAQPTNFSCWAAAGAMLVGWRDRVSLTPDTVAASCSRSTASGLLTDDNAKFAAEMGFIAVPPVCYTEDGFRSLLENNGPLWVSEGVPPNLHAIVVTGMYSDGSNTYVRIADPWDRAVGSPGKPGAYAPTHVTGSRYIMQWDEFTRQYEAAITGNPPNRQILHTGNPNALAPNTGQTTPPPGYAQSVAAREMPVGRGLAGGQSFTINWDEVQQIAQPTNVSCWATAAAMVLGWRDRMSLTVEGIAERAALTTAIGLDPAQVGQFAVDMGMIAEPPQSYAIDSFRELVANNGPLWIGAAVPGLHAIVVTGLYGDGAETYVRVTDPWDRDIGTPGVPGAYLTSHATGSRYIMRWGDFVAEYERAATDFARVNLQILHCGGTFGHAANTGGSTPPGYAMAYVRAQDKDANCNYAGTRTTLMPPPPPRARAMSGTDSAIPIGGAPVETVRGSQGNVSWALDQFHGPKHPGDVPPATSQGFSDAPTIRLDQWPVLRNEMAVVSAFFAIDWLYDGRSIGDVRISKIAVSNGATALDVRGQIIDDVALYPPGDCASLKVRLTYRFQNGKTAEQIALTEVRIYGDGTHEIASQWQQSTLPALAPPGYAGSTARAMDGRGDAIAVAGILIGAVQHNEGGVTWSLDAFNAVKHPNDVAPNPSPPLRDAIPITLGRQSRGWVDKIGADFQIDWQFNGTSIGNIRMKNIWRNDALLANLDVRASIAHDNNVYDHRANPTDSMSDGTPLVLIPGFRGADNPANRQPCAAMRVTFDMSWDEQFSGTSKIQVELHLFGDGYYSHVTREVQ
jgi:N-acetyl-anhydromuramyl-L-alanine amidase AmpD